MRTNVRTFLAVATGGLLIAGGLIVIELRESAPQEPTAAAWPVPGVPVPEFDPPLTTVPSTPPPTSAPAPTAEPDPTAEPEPTEDAAPVRARSAMSTGRHSAPDRPSSRAQAEHDENDDGDDGDSADRDGEERRADGAEEAERRRDQAEDRRDDGEDRREARASGDGAVVALAAGPADTGSHARSGRDRPSLLGRTVDRLRDRVDRTCGLLRLLC